MAAPTTTSTTTATLEITEEMTSCTPLQLAVRVAQLELEIARDAYAKFIVTELEHVMPPLASLREDLIKCMHASLASQWNGKISKLAAAASTVLSSCPVDITSMQLLLKGYSPDEMEKALKDGSSALNYRIFAMHVHGPDSDVVLEHMIQLDKHKHALVKCEQSLFQLHEEEAKLDVASMAASNPRFVADSAAASALASRLTGSYAEESRKRFQQRIAHCESIHFTSSSSKRQCVDLTEEKQDDDDVVPVHSPVKGRILEFMHANKKFVQDAFIKQTARQDAMACRTSGDTWALSQDQRERLGLVSSTLIRGLKCDPKVPLERFCVFLFGTAFTPNLVGLCSAAVYWTDPRDCIEVALKIKARLEDFVELRCAKV